MAKELHGEPIKINKKEADPSQRSARAASEKVGAEKTESKKDNPKPQAPFSHEVHGLIEEATRPKTREEGQDSDGAHVIERR